MPTATHYALSASGVQTPVLTPELLTPQRLDALLCEIQLQRQYAEAQFPQNAVHSPLGLADYMQAALGAALAVFVMDVGGPAAGEAVLLALGVPVEQVPEVMQSLLATRLPTEG